MTTITSRKIEVKRKPLEATRAIRVKLNTLRASEVAERQAFKKKCVSLIQLVSTTWRLQMVFQKKLSASNPSREDVSNFKDMLITTQFAFKNHNIKKGPRGSRSGKYAGLISKLVKKEGCWRPGIVDC